MVACLPIILGTSVLWGWYNNNQALIQVMPSFAPMQFNTALGFLLSGFGLILLIKKYSPALYVLGFLISSLGGLTLLQYIFNVNFGIDELFMDASITTKTSHPGRMAPNTALCFFLCGLAFILHKFRKSILLGAGGAIFILSFLALIGYILDEENIYGWGTLTRMAIHTCVGFLIISTMMLYFSRSMKHDENIELWSLAPFSLSLIVAVLTIFSWHTVRENVQIRKQEYFDTLVANTEDGLRDRLDLYQQALWGGVGLFHASEFVTRDEWKLYVEALDIENKLPGLNGIGYIDYVQNDELDSYLTTIRNDRMADFENHPNTTFADKFIIRYIEPENRNKPAIGLDIGYERNRRDAAEHARDHGVPTLTRIIQLVQDSEKEPGFLLLMPLYNQKTIPTTSGERRSNFKGWVYAALIGKNILRDIDKISYGNLEFDIYDGTQIDPKYLIFSSSGVTSQKRIPSHQKITTINIAERKWTIKWRTAPDAELLASNDVPTLIFSFGILLSAMLYFALSSLQKRNDVTEKEIKKQTRQLKKSQEFMALIMNSIPDLVFVKDKEFRIVRANQAFLSIFSPDVRHKVIGYTTVENFSKEEVDVFLEQDKIAFKNGIAQTHEEIEIYTGDKINIFTTKVRFTDENNEEYILCISRDVSDLVNTQKDLERKVEERTKKYKEQKILAEKAGKAKEEFLANMSHELRTPLNSIVGLTNILIDEDKLEKEDKETLSIVQRASQSLLKTVNDILDISKIESGKIQLDNKSFNLIGLLYSLVDQFKPLASQKGIDLYDNLSELEDSFVCADEHRISRIVTNLVSNAIKYTHEGTVEITFKVEEENEGIKNFIIEVKDTGIGISKEYQKTIFDKFSQADKSIERLYGGTGLGLNITKQLVDLMLGSIAIESELGKGSTFSVKLPLAASDKDQASDDDGFDLSVVEEHENVSKISISQAKILVAEDHEFNKVFIRKILQRLGNDNFKIVENGVDALSEFKEYNYDLVLMDYHMPRMNGYETTRKIREYEDTVNKEFNTPIIAMTADVMPGTKKKCLQIGMNDYVPKPIDENFLRKKIEKWLYSNIQGIDVLSQDEIEEDEKTLDLSLLNSYTDGDLESQKELIEIFYSKSKNDIEELKDHCEDGPSKEWVEIAHSLKGSSSYIGAITLKDLCDMAQSMYDVSKAERLDMYKKIKAELDKAFDQLEEHGLLFRGGSK